MNEVSLLDGYELKQLFRRVGYLYNRMQDRQGRPHRPPLLFETLLRAYPDLDADALMVRLESLAADHGSAILSVVEDHSQGSLTYVESRDFLYDEPEVLLIADLARHYPRPAPCSGSRLRLRVLD